MVTIEKKPLVGRKPTVEFGAAKKLVNDMAKKIEKFLEDNISLGVKNSDRLIAELRKVPARLELVQKEIEENKRLENCRKWSNQIVPIIDQAMAKLDDCNALAKDDLTVEDLRGIMTIRDENARIDDFNIKIGDFMLSDCCRPIVESLTQIANAASLQINKVA
jgi:hypothetical protein